MIVRSGPLLRVPPAYCRFCDDTVHQMQGLAVAMRYPSDSSVPAGQATCHEDMILAEEEEAAMEERRHELCTLLRNVAKVIPDSALGPVQQLLRSVTVQGADPLWQDVEVAVVMLYELGEALVDDVNSDGCGAFKEPVSLLMAAGVPHQEHRLVAASVLECFVSLCCLSCAALHWTVCTLVALALSVCNRRWCIHVSYITWLCWFLLDHTAVAVQPQQLPSLEFLRNCLSGKA